MKKISLLVYEDAILSCVTGTLDMLVRTNRMLESMGKPPAFEVSLVCEKKENNPLLITAPGVRCKTLKEVTHTDLIIAPAFNGLPDPILQKNIALVHWIQVMHNRGVEVASLCFGSYFLAESGVLAGKSCTSHWMALDDMRERYPEVKILSDMVITDQEGIYTSGGAFSSLNLVLYIIEKFCGREVGIMVSKMFSIDMDRTSQSHFAVFQGQRKHDDEDIRRAQMFIEENFHRQISVEEIAEQSNMSKRNFIRRFKKATQNTPLEYLQRVKIESAKKALERSSQDISSLMYDVGYNDVKTFRMIFKRITGLTPQEYQRKYNRAAVLAQAV